MSPEGNPMLIAGLTSSRAREGILPLCSVLVRPQLEHCIQVWSPQHRRDADSVGEHPEEGHKNDPWDGSPPSCEDRLRELGLFSLGRKSSGRPDSGFSVTEEGL